ncbi:tetratricopeptide repeat protein [Bremerella sp. P1]|uniref:tetratricopeptide repeat protein n=1 Tax=Bremerella sp. P1 TaxID=3026424 RepID=UPI0023683D4F|nr:tetratricopeptide repeat protein [Bremerella sp. P1]WDI44599.1 hypothetical protein PSR63_11705 [Bremerella sp. P1]
MPWNVRLGLVMVVVCFVTLGPWSVSSANAQSSAATAPEKVQALITQLGDRNFTVRERAQTDLARMGIAAFDQLFGAMRDPDLEIARRAQYLIRSVEIEWTRPEFSDEVNAYLNRYGNLNVDNRRSRIGELSRLHTMDALSALCRIARYDVSEVLSKEAALAAAIQFQGATAEEKPQIIEIINARIGDSPRVGPSWMKIFRTSLNQPDEAIAQWEDQITEEIDLFTTRPGLTSQQVVLDLVRWEVDQLRQQGQQEEALATMEDVIRISAKFSESELLDLTTWFLDRKGPSVVGQLAEYHAKKSPAVEGMPIGGPFGENPSLLYLLAESELVQDNIEKAEQYAKAALSLEPDSYDSHYLTAQALSDRGTFRWSRNEYRYVIDSFDDVLERESMLARMQLGELENDLGDPDKAAEVMWPWVEAVEKKFGPNNPLNSDREEAISRFLARSYLFRATAAEKRGDLAAAKKDLDRAVKYYEDEADVLIAAYRVGQQDDMWKAKAKEHIDHTIDFYKPFVEKFQKQYEIFKQNSRGDDFMGAQGSQMANYCNQYAWLVCNTYGDFDHAVEASELSLEMQPGNGAYLDTLAHCHAAKKDWASAVKYQRMAAMQIPHSGMIREKFQEFAKKCEENNIEYETIELPASPDTHFPEYKKEGKL